MRLRCPHCEEDRTPDPGLHFGDWAVCPSCELPFPWRDAPGGADDVEGSGVWVVDERDGSVDELRR